MVWKRTGDLRFIHMSRHTTINRWKKLTNGKFSEILTLSVAGFRIFLAESMQVTHLWPQSHFISVWSNRVASRGKCGMPFSLSAVLWILQGRSVHDRRCTVARRVRVLWPLSLLSIVMVQLQSLGFPGPNSQSKLRTRFVAVWLQNPWPQPIEFYSSFWTRCVSGTRASSCDQVWRPAQP